MARFECSFFSSTLGLHTAMNVILPDGPPKTRFPTLYLLHGLSDDHTNWLRRTSVERYAEAHGLAVVIPNVHRSFYTDMKHGLPYWTFISEEVPSLARSWFPLSEDRERNYAAGLSMGGYGAFKLALRCPDRFAAGVSLSGALDAAHLREDGPVLTPAEFERIFGSDEALRNSQDNLFHAAETLAAGSAPAPKLFQCCGTEDFLYGANLRFRDHARKLGFDLYYEEGPGSHEWGYWDAGIQRALDWLPIPGR
ncbi:esterase family protein [Cohnella pontilimi]|uniref:Esterase family protein n=1 Tax=Cohnella pontilimi TaxID=2564100 RepID=A0A4U0FCN3_9BACL|nr:alpha/beta hydrolase family protein [Cohnella pontilimi]TJY42643.1 esterase family protein [Cohnella pontilimi]